MVGVTYGVLFAACILLCLGWLTLLVVTCASLDIQMRKRVDLRTLQGGAGFLSVLLTFMRFAYFVIFLVYGGIDGDPEIAASYWTGRSTEREAFMGILHDAFFPMLLFAIAINLLHWYVYLGATPTSVTRSKLRKSIGYDLERIALFDAGVLVVVAVPLLVLFTTTLVMKLYGYGETLSIFCNAFILAASVPQMLWVISLSAHLLRVTPRRKDHYIHSCSKLASNKGPLKLLRRIILSASLQMAVSVSALLAPIFMNDTDIAPAASTAAFIPHHVLELAAAYGVIDLYVTVSDCLHEHRVTQARIVAYEKMEKDATKERSRRIRKARAMRIKADKDTGADLAKWAVDYSVGKATLEKERALRVSHVEEEAAEVLPDRTRGVKIHADVVQAELLTDKLEQLAAGGQGRRRQSSVENEATESRVRLSSSFGSAHGPSTPEGRNPIFNPIGSAPQSPQTGGGMGLPDWTNRPWDMSPRPSDLSPRPSDMSPRPSDFSPRPTSTERPAAFGDKASRKKAASLSYAVAVPRNFARDVKPRNQRRHSERLRDGEVRGPHGKRPSNVMDRITQGLRQAGQSIAGPNFFGNALGLPSEDGSAGSAPAKMTRRHSFDTSRPRSESAILSGFPDVESPARLPPIHSAETRENSLA